MQLKLRVKLAFPEEIVVTSLALRDTKAITMVKLSVHQVQKYQRLGDKSFVRGWHMASFSIDVSCYSLP